MGTLMFKVLHLVAIVNIIDASFISSTQEPTSGPKWPTEYYFKGEIIDVFNAGSEPFEIWYSKKLNRSRLDVYDGTVKKYYWNDLERYVMIHPIYKDTKTVNIECEYGKKQEEAYNILPKGTNWDLIGTGTYNGVVTQIWQVEEPKNHTRYQKTVTTRKAGDFDVPISVEILKYKLRNGMTVGHLNIVFYAYNLTVQKESVDIPSEKFKECNYSPFLTMEERIHHLTPYIQPDVAFAFDSYKSHHKKMYHGNEHEIRQEIFENNWRRVVSHNRKNSSYKLELNQFADWTEEELMSLTGTFASKEEDPGTHPFPHTLEEIDNLVQGIPAEYDLRIEGALPAIKNQQACGSCWAFATTATVEAAIIKKLGGVQLDLSEQSLLDCGWPYGVLGCNGGFVDRAFKYVTKNGIPTEAEYGSYMHEDGVCHTKNMSRTYRIEGYTQVTPLHVNALKYAVYTYGPVEVSMHSSEDMLLYSSGVFYDMSCEGQYLNHAVVVVGYGTREGEPYWIIRNSWGETWGEDGYILMSARDNNCLILDAPYYPVV